MSIAIGINLHPGVYPLLEPGRGLVDFLEISPDLLCEERDTDSGPALHFRPDLLDDALTRCRAFPLVVHGLGLSIGTATGYNASYLDIVEQLGERRRFAWHSEHLGFLFVEGSGDNRSRRHAGVQLPMPMTRESLDLLVPRVHEIRRRFGVPFLLENTTHYLPDVPHDPDLDEAEFISRLCAATDCGVLLDLYNLYCNTTNFGLDPYELLWRMPLERVVEIHLAGGSVHEGLVLDVHSDGVPDDVWALLAWVLPRVPALRGVVFEVLEQAVDVLGLGGIEEQLRRCRERCRRTSWGRRHVIVA